MWTPRSESSVARRPHAIAGCASLCALTAIGPASAEPRDDAHRARALLQLAAVDGGRQREILLQSVDDRTRPWVRRIMTGFQHVALSRPHPPAQNFESLDATQHHRGARQL